MNAQTTISQTNTRKGVIAVVQVNPVVADERSYYKVTVSTSGLSNIAVVETTYDLKEALAVARGMYKAIELWN